MSQQILLKETINNTYLLQKNCIFLSVKQETGRKYLPIVCADYQMLCKMYVDATYDPQTVCSP
jgi:hypothetical protein